MADQTATLAVALPDETGVAAPVYANVAHVSTTPYDLRITFSLLVTPHGQDGSTPGGLPALMPRAVTEVVLPSAAVESLIELLRVELDAYVQRYGRPAPAVNRLDV